jgi:hypothetical protein
LLNACGGLDVDGPLIAALGNRRDVHD